MPKETYMTNQESNRKETSLLRSAVGVGALTLEGVGMLSALLVEGSQNASIEEMGATLVGGLVIMVATGVAAGKA